jgi:hypothetical protein
MLGGKVRLLPGDCREVMATLPDASVDAIVCDPPYGLGFMGRAWDAPDGAPFAVELWQHALRVLKPGGHLVAFSGTRTYHRMACAIEDAGFEIRDQLAWVYGSGFPKSLDVSKAIDKARDDSAAILRVTTFMADAADQSGITRADVDGHMQTSDMGGWWLSRLRHRCQCPKWDQWLRLKVLLKLSDEMDAEVWRLNGRKGKPGEAWDEREVVGSVKKLQSYGANEIYGSGPDKGGIMQITAPATDAARQWQGWGTALKPSWEPICLARKPLIGTVAANVLAHGTGALNIDGCRIEAAADYHDLDVTQGGKSTQGFNVGGTGSGQRNGVFSPASGRWPANLITDGSEEVVGLFPEVHGAGAARDASAGSHGGPSGMFGLGEPAMRFGDSGSAARFFYQAKADSGDRLGSSHPTVKPVDLMQWLCRLVCPKGGVVLDPFAGTGTTGEAAWREGMRAILIEREPEYQADIARRMDLATQPTKRSAVAATKNKLDDPNTLPLFAGAAE